MYLVLRKGQVAQHKQETYICENTGNPINDCLFQVIPDSYRQSEYDRSKVYFQSKCAQCGTVMFHSRTEDAQTDE